MHSDIVKNAKELRRQVGIVRNMGVNLLIGGSSDLVTVTLWEVDHSASSGW